MPETGAVASRVVLEVQIDCALPASAVSGLLSTVIVTSSNEGGQMPLEIVHLKIFIPGDKAET